MPNKYNNTRSFTWDNPALYNGQDYPTTLMPIDDGTGNIQDTTVFADRSGNYFTQAGTPVILQQTLPEVVVRPAQPTQEEMATTMFNNYLTMSNDKTKVSNVPHKQYNPHLNDRTLQGAKSNAIWEKEHPNLDAWGKTLAAIPFAVAAAPAAMAGGKAMLGTTAGQYIKNKVIKTMANPLVEMANTGLGLGFGAKGAYDVSQGDVTPSTLLELAGIYSGIKAAKNIIDRKRFVSELDWTPESWFSTRIDGIYDKNDIKALKAHIPEYHKIEKQAKANGTWLKMPDGSTWEGDPRSWVQMMSKDYDKYTGNSPFKYQAFSHSSPNKFDTFDYKYFGATDEGFYGRGFYTHPAENINGKLVGRNSYGDNNYLLSTNVQNPFDLNNPNFEYAGLYNWENTNAPKGIFDGYDSVYYGIPGHKSVGSYPSELVVTKPNNYKALLGNNGNFDFLNPNMYKAAIPLGITAYSINQSK